VTPLSVQLYSLREASARDFDGVLQAVSAMGYQGVEPFNLFGRSPEAFRRQVEALGMTVSSSHFPWANRTGVAELVDVLGALGLSRAVGGFAPDDFRDLDAVRTAAEASADLAEQLAAHGITLALHNHWWEFELIEGRPAYHYLQELVPSIEFEIDVYWAANFGSRDPAVEIERVRDRTPLLHVKDGPLVRDAAMVAVGTGRLDIPQIVRAADQEVLEWLIVELDDCDTDMLEAIRQSRDYLVRSGLGGAHG
jgi:sugar phosphate isomerase/epimerase